MNHNSNTTVTDAAILQKAAGAVACQKQVLPSGLTILCRPMPGYSTVHAIYGTAFGATTRVFTLGDKTVELPAGTAHFLEHKMFESEQGDAFDLYAKTGAAANAYTGYERTCYVFSATDQLDENLDILFGMVGKPYFTEATIRKEQGIIGQEIKMYDDNPDWRLLTGLFRCLYQNHPIRDDIAGTVETIARLTPELLYACTDAFYRPENMVLAVAGNVTMAQLLAACARAGLDAPRSLPPAKAVWPEEPATVFQKEMHFTMPLTKPAFALGFKEKPIRKGDSKQEILCDIMPFLVCGGLTDLYRRLYDEGLVNPEFGGSYISTDGCCCVAFTGESNQPRFVAQLVQQEIDRLRREGVDRELFTLVKNQMYGEVLADLESVEAAASEMAATFLKGRSSVEDIETLATLTAEDADAALQTMMLDENSAYVEIQPEKGAGAKE